MARVEREDHATQKGPVNRKLEPEKDGKNQARTESMQEEILYMEAEGLEAEDRAVDHQRERAQPTGVEKELPAERA